MTTSTSTAPADCVGEFRDDYALMLHPYARNYVTRSYRCSGCGERRVWVEGLTQPIDVSRFYSGLPIEDVLSFVATVAMGRHDDLMFAGSAS